MSNVPKLRFREFSGEWEEKRYGDIYSFYTTNSFSRDNLNYENGSVYNIHYGDIHTKFSTMFYLENENVPYINNSISLKKIKEENYCQIGDLVIADASEDYNDIGKTIEIISLNNTQTLAGLHTFLARPNKFDMALGYAGYMLQSWKIRKQVMTIAQGTKILGLATSRLSKIKLELPSKQEQEKIASFLTSVDTKIQLLTKKEERLSSYKKGLMQKIFSQEIRFKDDVRAVKSDENCFSSVGSEPQAICDSTAEDKSEFPEWEEKKLESLLKMTVDNRGKTPPVQDKGIPLIEVNAIGQKEVHYNKVTKYVSETTFNDWFRKYLENGDVLFSTVGNTAICSLYDSSIKAVIAQNIVGLRFNEDCDSCFMYYLLTEEENNFKFKKIEMGAVQPSVKVSQMIHLIFSVPCSEEQTKIANFLSAIDSKIEQVQKQLSSTKEFKKALLQQMFV